MKPFRRLVGLAKTHRTVLRPVEKPVVAAYHGRKGFGLAMRTATYAWLCLAFFVPGVHSAFVSESASELATSADLNGDQLLDLLLVNKLTGEIRVGYQQTNGALAWSLPRSSGLSRVAGVATGRFLSGPGNAIAVSSPSGNLIHLLDLADPSATLTPAPVATTGVGPASLAGVVEPAASADKLAAATEGNGNSLSNQLEVLTFNQGTSSVAASLGISNRIERLHGFRLAGLAEPHVAAIERGTTDAFKVFRVSPTITLMAEVTNLHAGSDYVFANFGGGQRVLFYTPGVVSGLVESSLAVNEGGQVVIGPGVAINNVGQPIRSLSVVSNAGIDQLVVILGSGETARIYDRARGGVTERQILNAASGEHFLAAVAVGEGRWLMLSTETAFGATSTRFGQLRASGRQYTDVAQGSIPGGSAEVNRANLWLFEREPFVSTQPRFLASLNGADWTESASGLPGSLAVLGWTDAGPTNGLSAPASINLGAPPAAAGAALVNQYHPTISFFSYSLPRPNGASEILITPPPGRYPGDITISFVPANLGDSVFYRLTEANAWQTYTAPFVLSNSANVRFYGQAPDGSRRSGLQLASYTLPGTLASPDGATTGSPTNNPSGGATNSTSGLIVSSDETLIYGRRGTSGGSIWAIHLNGTTDRQLTTGARPRLSPDGRRLAFLRDNDPFTGHGNIWVRDLATSQERRLFENGDLANGLDWDQDSQSIFFDFFCKISRIDLEGPASELNLPFDCYDDAPARSPQGVQIAFHNLNPDPNIRGLYVANLEIGLRQKLPIQVLSPRWPSWSPDGRWLAVAGDGGSEPPLNQVANLYVVSADGVNSYQITAFGAANDGFPYGAIWSPDGRALIGAGSFNRQDGIYVVPLTPDLSACAGPPSRLDTKPGDPIDFVGSVTGPPPSPDLFISSVASDVIVSWRTSVGDFNLEFTRTLGPGALWQVIPGPFPSSGGFFRHLVPPTDRQGSRHYRLHRGSVIAPPPSPDLFIASVGSDVIVSWRTTVADFNLEFSRTLGPSASWQITPGPFPSSGGFFEDPVPPADRQGTRYYRLHRP